MIVATLCNSCLQPFRIVINPGEAALLGEILEEGDLVPCPRLCGGRVSLSWDSTIKKMSEDTRLREPLQITGTELYRAVFGGGLPDEIPKSREAIEALLLAHRVKKVELEQIDRNFYLHEIRLENDVVIHLSAGARGAQVLKITKGVPDERSQPTR